MFVRFIFAQTRRAITEAMPCNKKGGTHIMSRTIKVNAVRREMADPDQVALALWLIAKSRLRERREREARERAARLARAEKRP